MKRRTKILALIAVMALFAGLAAGCTDSSSNQDPDEETSPSGSSSDSETTQTMEAIAEVVSVNESNLEVRFYTANSEDGADIEDYTTVNLDDYTASLDADTLTVADSAEILAVREGELADAALEDVEAGAVIAVTYVNQKAQKIVILDVSQEQKTLVAEVTAISEDGQLSLTRYALTSHATETDLIDYAHVDLTLYEATEETDEYTIADETQIYVAQDGVLTQTTSDEIAVADVLVFYQDEEQQMCIAIYHPQAEDTSDSEAA